MKDIILSEEQKDIVNTKGNLVVIANPGSGKTTTLAFKISEIFKELDFWKGVIAISYTNDASDKLKNKVNSLNIVNENSFFGTIDKFYIYEIILPFFKNIYGIKTSILYNLEILKKGESEEYNLDNIEEKQRTNKLVYFLKSGKLVLEYISDFALFILKKSEECRKYLKSRYSHICIDEYQDCDEKKHKMFISLVELGIIGVAIGDPNQSIFAFAGSSAKYLLELCSRPGFLTKPLTENRRNHENIENYALKFLNKNHYFESPDNSDKRIHIRYISGKEEEIANWIDNNISTIMSFYDVEKNSQIGILVRNNKTGIKISKNLRCPNRNFINTPLDESVLYSDIFFKYIIMYIFGEPNIYIDELVENYNDFIKRSKTNEFIVFIKQAKKDYIHSSTFEKDAVLEKFVALFKNEINKDSIVKVLNNSDFLNSYKPLNDDELNILTIHRSKGLEFKIVFILDHYKYILPSHNFTKGDFQDLESDKNLHYVAITRAEKAVFFLGGNKRTNSRGEIKEGVISEFLDKNNNNWGYLSKFRTEKQIN